MKWFKHDSNAHTDAKLQKVLMRFGADGYATYWYCLELIARKVDSKNVTFELEHDAEIIGYTLKIDQLRVEEMMLFMCELGLFESAGGIITCLKMMHRLDDTNAKNPQIRALLQNIPTPEKDQTTPNNSESIGDAPNNSGQSRLDKTRLEKKVNKKVGFQPPSSLEVQEYLDEKGISGFTGEDFVNYYASVDWMRGKNKIKSWKHCVGTWKRNTPEKEVSMEIID